MHAFASSVLTRAPGEIRAMTDPDQSGTSKDEAVSQREDSAAQREDPAAQREDPAAQRETPEQDENQSTEAESTGAGTAEAQSAETESIKTESAEAGPAEAEIPDNGTETSQSTDDTDAQATEEQQDTRSKPKRSKAGLLLGLVSGAFVLLLAVVLVAFFVWPGYAGPGNPQSKADEAAAALASKDAGRLDQVACHGEDGQSLAQISPQALQLVQSAKPAGGPQMILDTEAHAPVDLTLSAQGQTQTLPSTAILGVSDHQWCLKGLAQRQ